MEDLVQLYFSTGFTTHHHHHLHLLAHQPDVIIRTTRTRVKFVIVRNDELLFAEVNGHNRRVTEVRCTYVSEPADGAYRPFKCNCPKTKRLYFENCTKACEQSRVNRVV